jgi:hypothetical protein
MQFYNAEHPTKTRRDTRWTDSQGDIDFMVRDLPALGRSLAMIWNFVHWHGVSLKIFVYEAMKSALKLGGNNSSSTPKEQWSVYQY